MNITRDEIVACVNNILVDEFEVEEENLKPENALREDLELDSLDAVDMIVALEQQLSIRVDEEKAKEIRTIGDVYTFVEAMLLAKTSGTVAEAVSA